MRTVVTLFLIPVFALALTTPARAQTSSDVAAALVRMDSIIKEMEKLRTEFASLSATLGSAPTPTPQVQGVSTAVGFTESLEYGATNDDIKYIQSLLATDPDIYPYGVASGFFGPKTQDAIRNLQERFGLDPVGVVGPATRTILEAFKAAYPTGAFPDGVLKQVPKPQVQGVSTIVTPTPTTPTPAPTPSTPTTETTTQNPIRSIEAEVDRGEAEVYIDYRSKNSQHFIVSGETKEQIAKSIAQRTKDKLTDILEVLSLEDSRSDEEEDEADDRLQEIDDLLDEVKGAIEEADDDGEDVDDAEELYDEAKDIYKDAEDEFDDEDYDKVLDLLDEAEELLEEALEELGGGSKKDKAKEAIKDAEDAIDDAKGAIEEADDDGEDVDDAEDLLEEAEDLLEEAEEAYDDEDYDDAIELAEEAEDTAKDAEDEL